MIRVRQTTASPPKARQKAEDGVGPLYHRIYWIDFVTQKYSLEQIMGTIKAEFANYSPQALLEFEKSKGQPWEMKVGDEYQAQLMGGWKGSVRVIESTPCSFAFSTLKGHPEAGHIRFSIRTVVGFEDVLRFEIESWARSRDGLVQLAYQGFRIGRWLQRQVWTSFCRQVVKRFAGRALDRVVVITEVIKGSSSEVQLT